MNIYELNFTGRCPNNKNIDKYTIEFIGLDFVEVENLVGYLEKFQEQHKFQEVISDEIAEEYDCEIKIVGYHGKVKITTRRNYA